LIPNGSSFKAVPEPDFLTTSDGWFRPVSEQVGPDGALWIADWYDKYPCYQNAQADPEGVDRERGRIWRVVYNTHAPGRPIGTRPDANMDLRKMKSEELVKLLEHPNVWQRRMAQKLLNERRHPEALLVFLDQLGAVAEKAERVEGQMAALSILHSEYPVWDIATVNSSKSDLRMPENLKKALASDNANVRAWFARNTPVQLRSLKDKQAKDQASALFDEIVLALERLAADPDPRVRLAVATACRQLVSSSLTVDTDINTNAPVGKILATLIRSSAKARGWSHPQVDGDQSRTRGSDDPRSSLDPLIPFMIWMAAEPLVAANPEPHLKWLAENGSETMPLSGILARKAMRRICDTGEPEKMNSAVRFLTQIASQTAEKPSQPEKTSSQLPETASQVAESASQLKKQPSQVAQPPSQVEKRSSQVAGSPSQVKKSSSQAASAPSQPAGTENSKFNAENLLLAALDGLIEGQRAKPLPPTIDTAALFAKNENASPQIKERFQQLGALWGDAAAIETTLAKINDASAPAAERIKAIQAAKQFKNDSARRAVLKLILSGTGVPPVSSNSQRQSGTSEALVIEAFQTFSALGDESSAKEIVKHWSQFSPRIRRIAAETFTSRSQWTRLLLDGLDDKTISPSDISATAARALFTSKNPNFVARTERVLGKFHESDADKLKLIKEKRKVVLQGTPNIERGHELARKTCFVCHKLHGEGAEVGPDLTGVGRSTLDALLANVIDPNQIVGKGYELVEVETKDGRTVNGRVVEETDGHLKLIAAGPTENVISKSDIASKRVSELSLMPEGLEQMPDEDFRDLIWFILSPPQEGSLTPEKRKALVGK
jgi:putative heme-binding domain-containing protein